MGKRTIAALALLSALCLTSCAVTGMTAVQSNTPSLNSQTPLAGRIIALDPGHNGGNTPAWEIIDAPLPDNGRGEPSEMCDAVGTQTKSGYPEHAFNWDVAQKLKKLLEEQGAQVVLSRDSDTGIGPCSDERATFASKANADLLISIHGNGDEDPEVNGFFTIISSPPLNDAQGKPSSDLADSLVAAMLSHGFSINPLFPTARDARDSLVTLNFASVPTVLIELGEMTNEEDAALMSSQEGRNQIAQALYVGITAWFLTR